MPLCLPWSRLWQALGLYTSDVIDHALKLQYQRLVFSSTDEA